MNMDKLIAQLQSDLSAGRFCHSIGTAECAEKLAARFFCDTRKAYLAGLLHDCATKLSTDEMLSLALETGLRTADEYCDDPTGDYHAKLGAVIARRDYGIEDPAVLQAIAYHQTGGVPMTRLDMIVGLADGIEPSRKAPKVTELREIAMFSLEKAYLEKHVWYMTNILNNHLPLSKERVDVYSYLLSLPEIKIS